MAVKPALTAVTPIEYSASGDTFRRRAISALQIAAAAGRRDPLGAQGFPGRGLGNCAGGVRRVAPRQPRSRKPRPLSPAAARHVPVAEVGDGDCWSKRKRQDRDIP